MWRCVPSSAGVRFTRKYIGAVRRGIGVPKRPETAGFAEMYSFGSQPVQVVEITRESPTEKSAGLFHAQPAADASKKRRTGIQKTELKTD